MAVNITFPAAHPIHEQVRGYREERERQERALEEATGGYASDEADFFDRGGKPLITFKDWLKSNRTSDAEHADRTAPVSREVHTPDASAWSDETPAWAKMGRLRILLRGRNR